MQEQLERATRDPLSEALLPVLVHRMNNTTQLLSNLGAVLKHAAGRDWLHERSSDLADAYRELDDTGYLMAVLASASGADLLLDRREARGVALMVASVGEVVRREGGTFREACQPLPEQAPGVKDGWQLAWAVGALLLLSARACGSQGSSFEWQLLEDSEAWVLVGSCVPSDGFASLAPTLAGRLPEAALDVRREGWSWRLPAAWLRTPPA